MLENTKCLSKVFNYYIFALLLKDCNKAPMQWRMPVTTGTQQAQGL